MDTWEISTELFSTIVFDGSGVMIRSFAVTSREADDWVAQDRTDAENLVNRLGVSGRLEKRIWASGETVLLRWYVYPWNTEG